MLAHIDVVGTQNQSWSSDPHTVTEKDGFLVGRGVSDDLGMAATELEVFLQLKRSGVGLRRDVILALTGDEESGGLGIRYLLDHRPELIDAATAINEGGGLVLGNDGKVKLVALQSAEKNYQDFTLTAQGTTGHSSVPLPDNAIYRLSRALDRVGRLVMPVRLSPLTREYFARRASLEPPAVKAAMLTLSRAQGTPPASALRVIEKDPTLSASLRTTCVATLLQGGTKENALPPSAQATINCRILPEESVSEVQKRLAQAIADRGVAIQPVSDFGLAGASPTDGEVPKAVEKITHALWPSAPVIPFMSRGATDSRYLRMKGITAYGIDPIALTEEDGRRAHGVDERISIASLAPAIDFLHRLVLELAAQDLTR
jgi:acetylornithine deacetylase/succinyl-diaminopimelate desuccinylase-like protein